MPGKIWTVVFTYPAKAYIKNIRSYTFDNFGVKAEQAYYSLIKQAVQDIRDNPTRPGSKPYPELGPGYRSFHLSLSRDKTSPRVNKPRHVVFYAIAEEQFVRITRILHERMDVKLHIVISKEN